MQMAFGFFAADISRWHSRLAPLADDAALVPRRRPVAQLVKSIISSRTLDAVSQSAFDRLIQRFPTAANLAAADPAAVEIEIEAVTFAQDKAVYVVKALRLLQRSRHGFDLTPLAQLPLEDALGFLETLPGVGRKVSASTLNASTLDLPVLIVDTHVLRVLQRLGAVDPHCDYRGASEAVTTAMPRWGGQDFLRFHVDMKRLGQTLCRPVEPRCGLCPLAVDCPSAGG